MPRYFIEVAYNGCKYSGLQIQQNANSIQAEVENALTIFFKKKFELTGSSRTDAGVHALQNFFHTDTEDIIDEKITYHINAILPNDIVVKSIQPVSNNAHCRFDAISREYKYFITQKKNPFLLNTAWHYPFKIHLELLNECAELIKSNSNYEAFCKNGTQVNNYFCEIFLSEWYFDNDKNCLVYNVRGNRFLRGMVKALVSTMLLVAKQKLTLEEFKNLLNNTSSKKADFSAPSHGLFLCEVKF